MALKGKLHIVAGCRHNRSYLKSAFYTPPFKVADVTGRSASSKLHLMLMNASPGVLDGDDYELLVELEEGASLQLETQSYQRLFQMKNSARQTMKVVLDKYAAFTYLPHPVVPHKDASFATHNQIFLEEGCSLIWGEVLTAGRSLNDEQFLFKRYHSKTEIFLCEQLIVKENILLQPTAAPVSGIGQMEGYTHQASLLVINGQLGYEPAFALAEDFLAGQSQICYGVSLLPVRGLVIRILGYKSEQLFNCLNSLAVRIQSTFGSNIKSNLRSAYAI